MSEKNEKSFWNVAPNMITALAAVAAVCYAHIGLTTWQQQLNGTADFQLAKELLKTTYELRGHVDDLRRALFMGSPHFPANRVGIDSLSESDPFSAAPHELTYQDFVIFYVTNDGGIDDHESIMYQMNVAENKYRELELLLIEAEALWGKDVNHTYYLFNNEYSILSAVVKSLSIINNESISDRHRKAHLDLYYDLENKYSLTYVIPSKLIATDDEFNENFQTAIHRVEEGIRPKLNRNF